jgi:hypothetical protein
VRGKVLFCASLAKQHAMKRCGSGDIAAPFLTWALDGGGEFHAAASLPPGKTTQVSAGQKAGWPQYP